MIHSLESSLPDLSLNNWKNTDLCASQTTSAGLSQSKSVDLVFYTQEGDKVTLSSSTQVEAGYASYEGMARAGGTITRQRGEAFAITTGAQFSLTVQGDLNAEETADIKKAVGVIDQIMDDLISGHYGAITKEAGSLGQLDSLQSMSADLHYQQQIVYRQQTRMTSIPGDSAAPTGLQADGTAAGASNSPEAAAVDGMIKAIQASRVAPDKWMNLLKPYFSSLEEKTAARYPNDPVRSDQVRRAQSALFHRMGRMGRLS